MSSHYSFIIFSAFTALLQCVVAQQQYFRIKPRDIKIHEGGEAMLECEIANLLGAVQWTKDGFALGFKSVIPGFPRYSIVGDRRHGVFNLRISNATLEDDAEFQCQVGPARFNKPIRANATLTVISPPSSIEIVDHAPNSKIEIRENQECPLECVVRNSKPAAKIVWYRGNVELKIPADKREDITHESLPDNNGGRKSTRRFDVTSRITLTPTAEDDYADYTCEARHEALPSDMPMRTSVQLSVLYPPGMPYIEGYTEGETIRRGQQVSLVCKSRGGNPPAQLIWYRNGDQVRMAYRTAGRVSENTLTFTAEAGDDKAEYKCEAKNIMSKSPLKAHINLTVLFAPAHVTISGPTEARVGDPVPLTCATTNSNPAAEIKWMVAGRQVKNASERKVISPEGGWITTSNITTVIEPGERSLVVLCHGLNQQLTENVVSTHNINVLYPPSQPIIQGYVTGTPIPAGTVKKISCISSGGNPLASLTWYKNDKKINSVVTKTEKSVSAELKILANATDNNAQYRCEAANSATEIPLFETVTLNVYFAPDNVKIQKQPNELKPNTVATLTCDSSSSHPAARLSWWREGIAVRGLYNTTRPGLHGGYVSSIELNINVTEDINGIVYTCQATNEALQRSVHDAITLQVLYKPVFDLHSPQYVVGTENEQLIINVKADGNPSNIAYTWTKDGLPITRSSGGSSGISDRIISDGSTLNITKVNRNDAGVYSCEATNSQGGSVLHINVSVEYSATIKSISEYVIINPMEDAILSCVVDGNPLTDESVTWHRSNYEDMDIRTTTTFFHENSTSLLYIHEATRDDVGEFICVVNNGIGNETRQPVLLIVKYKPELDTLPQMMKAASDTGGQGRLRCRASAAPKVRFTWSREGATIPVNASSKYFIEYHQIDRLTYESVLLIQHVTSSDYGPYECVARNEIGFASTSVRLEVLSAPDKPVSISVINVTHDSVTVAWTPGFDGGMKSSYRIRYRMITDDVYKYQDVPSDNQTVLTIKGLELGTEYVFSVMAMNKLGISNYLPDLTRAKTLSVIENLEQVPDELINKTDLPTTLIISVSIIGIILLLINVGLVACYVFKKRAKRLKEQSGQSSKSATIEMYAPSSYNDTVTGETLSSVSEKSETYSNEGSNADYVDEGRKTAASTYLIDQSDYPSAYPPNCPAYEMQMHPGGIPHKTHTLPHPHHHHIHHITNSSDAPRTKDDQSVGRKNDYSGNLSAKSSYISSPSPAPPADGSYYNMADRYLSYPPPLEFSHPHSHLPPIPTPPPSMPANGTLRRHHASPRGNMTVPPDVLHNTSAGVQNQQILHPQGLPGQNNLLRSDCVPAMTTFSNIGNYQGPMEQEGHLV